MSTENTVDTRPDPVAGSQCDHYAEEKRDAIPLVPIRGMGLFPGMVLHLDVGREKSMTAIDAVMAGEQNVFLAEQKDLAVTDPKPEDIFNVVIFVHFDYLTNARFGCILYTERKKRRPYK